MNKSDKLVVTSVLIWRILLFVPIFVGFRILGYRSGYEFSNISSIFTHTVVVGNPLIFPWANFDGVHYLQIAQRGYQTEGAFFPLFPMFIKLFSLGTSNLNTLFFIGIFISSIFCVIAFMYLSKLLRFDYPKTIADRTLLFILAFPTAFFFGMVYSESMFLMFLVLSFYTIRKEKWFLAILFSTLLCATRLVGIFIIPVLLYEYWQKHGFSKKLFLMFVPAAADIVYSFYCKYKWNDYLYFLHAHGQLANGRSTDSVVIPFQTVYRYLKIFTSIPPAQYEWWIALLELSLFMFALVIFVKAYMDKVRFSYILFSLFAIFLPVFSGTFSGLPRYLLVLFPIFISLALVKSKLLRTIYVFIGVLLQFVLLMFFSRGYFVA